MTDRNRVFVVLAYGFVLLGMPMTAMGVAWPSVAGDLGRTLGELGTVTVTFGAGYTVSTTISGRLAGVVPTGRLLIAASLGSSVGLSVITTSADWIPFLAAVTLVGLTAGVIDATTNTYVAIRRGTRAMGLIHATFGAGAVFGPLLVTVLLAIGASWRAAFALLAFAQLVSLGVLFVAARHLDLGRLDDDAAVTKAPRRSPMMVWSIIVFFLYAGVAAGLGAWSFTLLSEGRGAAAGTAGLAVTGYWAAFTGSRLILSAAGDRAHPDRILFVSGVATVAALALFWWQPAQLMGIPALILAGFAHGPIFPLEVLLTPRRFGAKRTAAVVGYEIAAANAGAALIPGAIGFLVGRAGLEAIPSFILFLGMALWISMLALRVVSAGGRHVAATEGT